MKFKVDDKVKILPSAIEINVAESEVGKTGVIVEILDKNRIYIETTTEKFGYWVVGEKDIALVTKVGQQLLFSFMEEK